MNFHMSPFRSPTGAWVCPCGQQFRTQLAAGVCSHPATGGKIPAMVDAEPPTDWWTARDELILRGQLAELAGLPRPAYVDPEPARMMSAAPLIRLEPPKRWVREIGAWLFIIGIALGVALLLSVGGERPAPPACPGDPAGCADFTTMPYPRR